MQPVESSAIEAVSYDPAEQILALRFTGGATYLYYEVPPEVFDDLLAAESTGRFVNGIVKPRFRAVAL